MRRAAGIAALLLACALALAGCKKQAQEIDPYAMYQTTSRHAGGVVLENANVADVAVSHSNGDTVIEMRFVQGSRRSDGSQETPATGIPAYSVALLPSPSRLAVSFDAVAYWDYERGLDLGDQLIYGSFRENFLGAPGMTVYFQLDSDVSFLVEEGTDKLTIRLHPLAEEGQEDKVEYFALANAFQDYCSGIITREYDVRPVLSRDLENVVLISKAFATAEEAEAFRVKSAEASDDLSYEQWQVVALYHNDLPIFDEGLDYQDLYVRKVGRIDGEETSLEVFTPYGVYLCETPGGAGFLYSRAKLEDNLAAGEISYYEELWAGEGEAQKKLLPFEFTSIEAAGYSPDGRRLAVLEHASDGSRLYIFDADTNELVSDLSEMGFGTNISCFAWDDLGSTIYAISGTSGMEVHEYDFTVSDEGKRHVAVDKNGADGGSIAFRDGEVYFVASGGEGGASIYRIKTDGGVRREYAKGSSFKISPDKRYMAYSTAGLEAEDAVQQFVLLDMRTGAKNVITAEFAVYDYAWSPQGDAIYFFENRLSGGDDAGGDTLLDDTADSTPDPTATDAPEEERDPYPYVLYRYNLADRSVKEIIEWGSTSVLAAHDGVLLPYDVTDDLGGRTRATYFLPTNQEEGTGE